MAHGMCELDEIMS